MNVCGKIMNCTIWMSTISITFQMSEAKCDEVLNEVIIQDIN